MGTDDTIYLKQYLISLFEKTEKVKKSETPEEWKSLSYFEKVREVKYFCKYHEKLYIGFDLLSRLFNYLHLGSVLLLLLMFARLGWVPTFWITLGAFLGFKIVSIIFTRFKNENWREYRMFLWLILNDLIR